MTSEGRVSSNAGHLTDFSLHDEIKCRAYELYEQRHRIDRDNPNEMLQSELPRVIYAAALLERHAKGEVGDPQAARAARVYLHALSAFIDGRDGN